MNIELNVKDRLVIISILKPSGSLQDMVIVFDIVKKLRFTEEDKKQINYREEDGKIVWDYSKEQPKEFSLTYDEIRIIKDAVDVLDKEQKIDFNNFETCLKFSKL